MNDIYQQLASQLGNPYAQVGQQRQMPQVSFGGGPNPFAGMFGGGGQRSSAPQYQTQQFQMPTRTPAQQSYGSGIGGVQSIGILSQLGQMLGGQRQGGQSSPYQMPPPDQRNPYPSTTPQAMDGTGWKNGMSPQAFQVANPYYGQTGYYGNLAQVQAQMAGKAQSSGIPTGVLDPSTYTQNPAGQTPWVPDLTPQQKVDQDLANWEANRWNPK